MSTDTFRDKAVIVTGASSGIGRAVALRLADQCAQIVLDSARRRKREVLMGPGWLAVWLKVLAPGLLDKITIEMFLKPAARRVQKSQDAR